MAKSAFLLWKCWRRTSSYRMMTLSVPWQKSGCCPWPVVTPTSQSSTAAFKHRWVYSSTHAALVNLSFVFLVFLVFNLFILHFICFTTSTWFMLELFLFFIVIWAVGQQVAALYHIIMIGCRKKDHFWVMDCNNVWMFSSLHTSTSVNSILWQIFPSFTIF